jgi:hypothetical protein
MQPHCSVIERDAVSCCPIITEEMIANLTTTTATAAANENVHERLWRFLAESSETTTTEEETSSSHSLCAHEYSSSLGDAACDEHKWRMVHILEDVIFAVTIFILSLFWIELNCMIVALGVGSFFSQCMWFFICCLEAGITM